MGGVFFLLLPLGKLGLSFGFLSVFFVCLFVLLCVPRTNRRAYCDLENKFVFPLLVLDSNKKNER